MVYCICMLKYVNYVYIFNTVNSVKTVFIKGMHICGNLYIFLHLHISEVIIHSILDLW